MQTLAQSLMAASAVVILTLGSIHLLYTFRGRRLHPRDPALIEAMKRTSPVLTRETTMWKTWIGFNASHSCSAILFGLIYGYLGWVQAPLLFHSVFLSGVGLVFLVGYVLLGRVYWFSIPFRGIVLSTVLYVAALVAYRL